MPCFNEQCVITQFHLRLMAIIERVRIRTEVFYINDGSQDQTAAMIDQFSQDPRVRCLHLSRNFGKEAAMRAGINDIDGGAVIIMDCDLQDPPELIPLMVQEWHKGYEIVNMQRRSRHCDSWTKRTAARLYYATLDQLIDDFEVPQQVSDFRLIGPNALAAIRAMDDNAGVLKLLVSWLGYPSTEVNYDRKPRQAGTTKWTPLSLLDLCADSILAFSTRPLRMYSYLSAMSFLVGSLWVAATATFGELTHAHLLVQSILLLCLGTAVVGEYVGRVLTVVSPRPNSLHKRDLS
ncbi:glycosyltransferase family 2 protein [Pseudomonas sp. LAP_36]|uniref:Glycosyltransferase family 2 protein n=1 Tax=Pseudomonas tritici TaxID=2745518 RepID=A0A8F4X0C4_9PSED|nr:glycosyltransferase family 2 protein [Pseudomonas sp. SWRI144]MBW8126028.1 glycosyltransferase family 2 protein [Pseudomonas sp. LAP_36]MBW8136357.1 glycosyltransferase family 2 protein [Pseudomonas sp. PAMC 26818]QXH85325.1 glycosyltransferase family 2 protein [Pseudomonas tritici]